MELLQHNTEGAARLTQTEARRRTEHVLATQLPLLQQWSEMQVRRAAARGDRRVRIGRWLHAAA